MARDKLIINGEVFTEERLLSGSCFIGSSIAGDELTVDTMGAAVDCSAEVPTLFAPADADGLLTVEDELFGVKPYIRLLTTDPAQFAYGQAVEYWRDEALFAVFYMSSIKRAGKYTYTISCTSAIGLLDNSTHYGGLYDGEPMENILADIVAGIAEYTVDPIFAGLPVYGWLPVGTRRENLHQLLFAMGASVRKNPDGTLYITALSEAGPAEIPDKRLFLGGKVDYGTPATSVAISEHAYIAYETDDATTLFEGEAAAEPIISPKGVSLTGVLVLFSGPMHDLLIENGAILESGVNYAVIDQSSDCKLTGQKYTHTTRVITRGTGQTRSIVTQKDNEVTVKDATLVSLANSENVADRVMAYYGGVRTVRTDIIAGGERPGDPVSFRDPFDQRATAFIKGMDITMSHILRASTDFAVGYVPTGIGNFYNNSALVTKNGTWTVPEGVTKIRVVLISGGQGGQSGNPGVRGEGYFNIRVMGKGGPGGAGGNGGAGGKVYVVTVNVTPGQVFRVGIGAGGTGGVCTQDGPVEGAMGGNTTFGAYSSADGKPSDKGYSNLFDGDIYALPGGGGMAGCKGSGSEGYGPSLTVDGVTYTTGETGETIEDFRGRGGGGAGGGAAYGANGSPGGDGFTYTQPNGSYAAQGGGGGNGGNGKAGSNAAGYGTGGSGGHGGGGGGAGGGANSNSGTNYSFGGEGGDGGLGGTGGKGAPGCIVIYY